MLSKYSSFFVLLACLSAITLQGCDNCFCGACDDVIGQVRTIESQSMSVGEELRIPIIGTGDAVFSPPSSSKFYQFVVDPSVNADSVVFAALTLSRLEQITSDSANFLVITALSPGSARVRVTVDSEGAFCDEMPLVFGLNVN